jgi:hypothetical protein
MAYKFIYSTKKPTSRCNPVHLRNYYSSWRLARESGPLNSSVFFMSLIENFSEVLSRLGLLTKHIPIDWIQSAAALSTQASTLATEHGAVAEQSCAAGQRQLSVHRKTSQAIKA